MRFFKGSRHDAASWVCGPPGWQARGRNRFFPWTSVTQQAKSLPSLVFTGSRALGPVHGDGGRGLPALNRSDGAGSRRIAPGIGGARGSGRCLNCRRPQASRRRWRPITRLEWGSAVGGAPSSLRMGDLHGGVCVPAVNTCRIDSSALLQGQRARAQGPQGGVL